MGSGSRVLITGFGPFLSETVNPTELLIHYINGQRRWPDLDVRGVVLPVEFERSFLLLEQEREKFKPDVVLCLGLAGGRDAIDLEQVALNQAKPEVKPEVKPEAQTEILSHPIIPLEPLALPSTLPLSAIHTALSERGVPVEYSQTAGQYVCNDLFFRLQARLRYTRIRSGFIHVPRLLEPVDGVSRSDSYDGPAGSATKISNGMTWSQFTTALDGILDGILAGMRTAGN